VLLVRGLSKAKVLISSRNSSIKLLPQVLVALILREIKLVEASMAGGQLVLARIVAVDIELGETIHAFQLLETVERDFTGTSDELQQFGALFFVEALDCAPEPLNLRRGGLVVVVLGGVLPVVDVDVWETGDEKLEFLLVEDGDELRGDDVVETAEESV
jgi:hypothetical protein